MATARRGSAAALLAALLVATPAAMADHRPEDCGKRDRESRRCDRQEPPPVAKPARVDGYSDPSQSLGATSPSCRYNLAPQQRRSCRASGAAFHAHPLSSYGIDVRVGFSLTDPGQTFMGALQSLGAAAWMAVLFLIKGVLLLLEWAFSLDLTREAMPEARRSLGQLHERAFGESWLLLGISIAGLWGMWRGLVQRRTTETFGGLAATVGLMVAALVVISEPAATVGRAAELSNEAGMSVLAAATTGQVDNPRQALTESLAGVFEVSVRDPWCALEFGSVEYCSERTGQRARPTNAEVWLGFPAQSWQRERLYKLVKGDDGGGFDPLNAAGDVLGLTDDRELPEDVKDAVDKSPQHVRMQEEGGTFPRLALLAMITVGLLGAVALYAYLGIRLLLAAGLSLILLLLAPAMLIAPAFGDSGRATFLAWARRLIGALAAKLIFAVFLAVVLAAGRTFTQLDIGWFGTWLLLGAFWWGVFLKRHEIIGFVSAGVPHSGGRSLGNALSHGYYAWMLGRGLKHAAGGMLERPARGVAAAGAHGAERRAARVAATRELAREQLDERGRRVLLADQAEARGMVGQRGRLDQEFRAVDRRLRGFDEAAAAARARGAAPPEPTAEQADLLSHRERLRSLLEDPAGREAVETVRHAERNRALTGEAVSHRDLEIYRTRRAAQLHQALPLDDERTLRAAGVDLSEYRTADVVRREQLLAQARESVKTESDLFAALDGDVSRAHDLLDPDEVRRRSAAHRARMREERRKRRAREGVFRVR